MTNIFRITGLIFGILLGLCANAQQINSAEYFFDTDPGVGNGTAIAVSSPADSVYVSGSISAAGLNEGFHQLFVRVRNANDIWSLYEGRTIYINPTITSTQARIETAEYFFDTDPGIGNGIAIATGILADSIDVITSTGTTALAPGFHHLCVRVKNENGIWSLIEGRTIYINTPPVFTQSRITDAEYFFDTDPGIGGGTSIATGSPADSIDVVTSAGTTALISGFHHLCLRVKNENGIWSLIEGRTIYINTPSVFTQSRITNAEYFFDADPGVGNGIAIATGVPADSIDITSGAITSTLTDGFHRLFVRAQNENGVWSLYEGRPFFLSPPPLPPLQLQIVTAELFFDSDPGIGNGIPIAHSFAPADSVHIFDSIPATGLLPGTHYLFLRVQNQSALWSQAVEDSFEVSPIGINEIISNYSFSIYPNPTTSKLTIESATAATSFELRDITGKLLMREAINTKRFEIDLSNYSSGIYFLTFADKDKQVHRKIVRE